MDVLTLKNYTSETSIMVAKQLKIVSQIEAKISATRNIICLKKACLLDSLYERNI